MKTNLERERVEIEIKPSNISVKKKRQTKEEKNLLSKKSRLINKISDLRYKLDEKDKNGLTINNLVLQQTYNEDDKVSVKKIEFDGRLLTPRTVRDIIFKKILLLNQDIELVNELLETKFKREIKRDVKRKEKRSEREWGVITTTYSPWKMKDVTQILLIENKIVYKEKTITIGEFDGFNVKTNANDVLTEIENYFELLVDSTDYFILRVYIDAEPAYATGEVVVSNEHKKERYKKWKTKRLLPITKK